jgi:diguanylate cyclase (GGDEF)-like protein
MTPGRLAKALLRQISVSWREQPNQKDIDELEANIARVGLVVRVRWAIVAALAVFSIVAAVIYSSDGRIGGIWHHMAVPAAALGVVLLYNAYYQVNYRRFGNLAMFNVVQLVLDILVVTLLIYYSGGVYSWFTSMYLLFVLEAALILPSRRQVWAIAAAAIAAYGTVLLLVYVGALPHTPMPFVTNDLQREGSYVLVRAFWELTILAGTASVGTLLMRSFREREERLTRESVRDPRTGLYNRPYFRQELGLDIARARRYRRGVSVVLADIDDLDRFNGKFGYDAGNAMLVGIAETIRSTVLPSSDEADDLGLAVAARYGGEEFALLVSEDAPGEHRYGSALAERLRAAVGDLRIEDRSVTVSVGVSAYPVHGKTAGELLSAADAALGSAYAAGGNRVTLAGASGAENGE